jgi:hypothetical protein
MRQKLILDTDYPAVYTYLIQCNPQQLANPQLTTTLKY